MHRFASTCLAAAFTFNIVFASPTASSPWSCDRFVCRFIPNNAGRATWGKWDELSNLFIFGASYAAAGPESEILDPIPPYKTSCNGPNYVDFLVNGFNKSEVAIKSYAIPGSPVSWSVLDDGNVPKDQTNSFVFQVDTYVADVKKGLFPNLSAKDSLYHMEFGINDINTAGEKYSSLESSIFDKYQSTFERLYQSGARNFLVLDVPPIDRSPEADAKGETISQLWKDSVISFNTHVTNMISTLGDNYPDTVFFRIGVNGLFSSVLDDVSFSIPTKVYKDTTRTCTAYANANSNSDTLPSKDYKSPDCRYAVNEYFWLTGYHPTYPMHYTMASEIAGGLQNL